MIGAILGASIASKIGLKVTFGLGFIGLSMLVFGQILPAWRAEINIHDNQDDSHFLTSKQFVIPVLFVGSITSGFGQAIIWVAQGEYISECANEETKGFFFALFWAFYMASQIFGNLTGALIITHASGPSFFLIMGMIMLFSVIGFFFIRKPYKYDEQEEEEIGGTVI